MVFYAYQVSENAVVAATDTDVLVLMIHACLHIRAFTTKHSDMIKENMPI